MTQFKDLGKKAKDLFKKQYDYKNEVKVINNSSGVKVETGGYQAKALTGYSKVNFSDATLGAVEIELHSCGLTKGQTKFKGVTDGVDVTLAGSAKDASVEATYVNDSVSVQAKLSRSFKSSSTAIAASAVVGVDGVSVGGSINLDAADPASPKDYNVGAEYTQKDLTASLVTSNMGQDITASYFQKVSGDLTLGSSMVVKPDAGSRLFTFGGAYTLDKATSLKAKADSNGIVGTSVTHSLSGNFMKMVVSAQFDALSSDVLSAQKLGVSLEF